QPATSAPDTSGPEERPPALNVPASRLPEATVHFKDGRQLTGLVVTLTDAEVVLRVSGVNATFQRVTIDHIERLPSVEERYQEMRRAIGDDGEQLMLLARWLMER